jgi:PncC family amidohydrolase
MAGVSEETLNRFGAVSEPCAREMCLGTAGRTGTDAAVSATGNAGPDASEGKPVGLVYIGVAVRGKAYVKEYHFEGDRLSIRKQAAEAALQDLLDRLT